VMPGILVRGCATLIDREQSCRQTAHAKSMLSNILDQLPAKSSWSPAVKGDGQRWPLKIAANHNFFCLAWRAILAQLFLPQELNPARGIGLLSCLAPAEMHSCAKRY
ncbi:MAG: hypothetical protein ACOYNF_00300, partial [Rhodoferax sp.]